MKLLGILALATSRRLQDTLAKYHPFRVINLFSKFVYNNTIMGAVKPLDKEITHYLGHLSTEQKKVVLSVVMSFAREEEAWADDKAYIAEMDKRYNELKSGKVKGLTLKELATKTRQAYKHRNRIA